MKKTTPLITCALALSTGIISGIALAAPQSPESPPTTSFNQVGDPSDPTASASDIASATVTPSDIYGSPLPEVTTSPAVEPSTTIPVVGPSTTSSMTASTQPAEVPLPSVGSSLIVVMPSPAKPVPTAEPTPYQTPSPDTHTVGITTPTPEVPSESPSADVIEAVRAGR